MTGYAVVFAPIAAIPASSRKSAQESVSHETEQALKCFGEGLMTAMLPCADVLACCYRTLGLVNFALSEHNLQHVQEHLERR